ncbi:unnamed protein product, partial [Laminaria digitata]
LPFGSFFGYRRGTTQHRRKRNRPLARSKHTLFSDRFFLGGPMTLRGFPFYGVGPRAPKEEGGCPGGDSLGGDIKYTGQYCLS